MTSENEYTDAAGVQYVAKTERGTFFEPCLGCAHDSGSIRAMKRGCKNSPPCEKEYRDDGRSIIWVKAEDGSRA